MAALAAAERGTWAGSAAASTPTVSSSTISSLPCATTGVLAGSEPCRTHWTICCSLNGPCTLPDESP